MTTQKTGNSKYLGLVASILLVACTSGPKEQNNETKANPQGETFTLGGNAMHTTGLMPKVGSMAPDFHATLGTLEETTLQNYKGEKVILNIFPSLDTPTCARSVRAFNEQAAGLENTVVLCMSMDLPFAQSRFCSIEGISNVVALSLFRSPDFSQAYGLQIADGPMKGLMARAIIVIDEQGKITYTELVKEVTEEPNYEAALNAVKG